MAPLPQRLDERLGVDVGAAGDVDEPRVVTHQAELGRTDHVPRPGREREREDDEVVLRQRLVQLSGR